ncbi:MAG: hypothetical protein ACRDV8_04805, partial [Acidimicrobiales bacterium]
MRRHPRWTAAVLTLVVAVACFTVPTLTAGSVEAGAGHASRTSTVAAALAVPATANIFGAGRAVPPDPAGTGGGTSPPTISLPAGTAALAVDATGEVTCCNSSGSPMTGPAGNGEGSEISAPGNGLSPYDGQAFALAGVFLGPNAPAGAGPAAFVIAKPDEKVLTPGIAQVFEVGTGSHGSNPRTFAVPKGATRFFLGFADAWGFNGTAGYYSDNAGALHVTVSSTSDAGAGTTTAMCRRTRIPDPDQPVLTTAKVDSIVHAKVDFTGETTNGTSVCVWSRTIPHITAGSKPVNGTLTWQVAVDGPLASESAAQKAYAAAAKGAAGPVVEHDLGDEAELVARTTEPRLLVQAGDYFLQFDSVNPPGETESGILNALADAVLTRLNLTPANSSQTITRKTWSKDWAGASFCTTHYDQPHLATFRGVASCGVIYVPGERSNLKGPTCYPVTANRSCDGSNEKVFNWTGFQCVEYALRYFYYMTGTWAKGLDDNGDDVATELYYKFHVANHQLGLVPLTSAKRAKGLTVGTRTYAPSLVNGDIISMWSGTDEAGHVGVVESTKHLSEKDGKYSGQITIINENA